MTRLAGDAIGSTVSLQPLALRGRGTRLLSSMLEGVAPITKAFIYNDNIDFFRSLDVLVVAEKTSLVLKFGYKLEKLKIVHTRHGAGDRAIGFNSESAAFDHVLVSGPKIRERLIQDAGVEPARVSIVGYPKFDLPATPAIHSTVDGERPVVLYNPHVSPHLSSWYKMGRAVLDWFVEHDEYQLIFAPHVMLFERSFAISIDKLRVDRPGRIDEKYLRAPNIHIDLGSRASTTMAYTNRADIYVGDVSSQVYEFLRQPRPCLFLDAHQTAWEGNPNYAHWAAGPVVRNVEWLGEALRSARATHMAEFEPVQRRLFRYSFDLTDRPSSERAAEVVARVAGLDWPHQDQPIHRYG